MCVNNELPEAGILEIGMAEPLRILILEDNPTDAELIIFELQEAGFTFSSKMVATEKEFVRELQDSPPDIILSDYDLPRYNGASALAEARRRCPDTPFILVTGAVSEDRAIEILTQGAKDYVLKNRLQQKLVPAVRRALAEAEGQKARKKAEAELREAHRSLEERVRIRTADLEAARKRMEEALLNLQSRESTRVAALRLRTEGRMKPGDAATGPDDLGGYSQKILQELQIHQIELEMMHEELMQSKNETDTLLAKHLDIYDFAPIGYFTLNPGGTILQANLTGAGLLHVERSLLIGRPFRLHISDASYPAFDTFFKKTVEGKTRGSCELMLPKTGGASRFVQLKARSSEDGKECYMSMMDITGRKQAETALEERTRQLQNVSLDLESFSFHVAHDLHAPLRAIDGYSRMILKNQEVQFNEEARNKFQMIRSNTEKMTKLIDALLSFSRLGRVDPSITQLDMEGIFFDVWKELKGAHPDRAMTLEIDRLPQCMGDRNLMAQVCSNILNNAVKFSRLRDVALIEIGGYPEENESVYYVRDNGIGFDMAFQDKLFSVFQRLHGEEYDGTGIGLALVKRIMNRLSGQVWAEAKINEGATFYFSLPSPTPQGRAGS
jgi:signal transduction histidine kinase/DNA-binding response OmpR family regulator